MNTTLLEKKRKPTEKTDECVKRISIYKKMVEIQKSLLKFTCEELNFIHYVVI